MPSSKPAFPTSSTDTAMLRPAPPTSSRVQTAAGAPYSSVRPAAKPDSMRKLALPFAALRFQNAFAAAVCVRATAWVSFGFPKSCGK